MKKQGNALLQSTENNQKVTCILFDFECVIYVKHKTILYPRIHKKAPPVQ